MAWLSGWSKRVKLTIDNTDIDSALTNFPILLYISASSGRNNDDISCVFDELTADANRKKIAVTKDDGDTECYVEIEKWDDANEDAWLWVKAPTVSNSADTDLYLYYDSTHADNDTYVGDTNDVVAESVWDSNFLAVYHMADGASTSAIYDSTSNDNDGTKKGAAEPAVTTSGKIGNAQDFDNNDDRINIGNVRANNLTVEALVKIPSGISINEPVVNLGYTSHADPYYEYFLIAFKTGEAAGFYVTTGGNFYSVSGTVDICDNAWHHIAGTYDGSTMYVYTDGADQQSNASPSGNINDYGQDAYIGGYTNLSTAGDDYYYQDIMDEVRISDTARSAAWIKATYETTRDELLDWGSEETQAGWTNISHVRGIAATDISHKKGIAVADISHVKGVAV